MTTIRISDDSLQGVIGMAQLAQKNAYAPYSDKFVGSAVLTRSGRVFAGCNVENKSEELRVCAERNALGSAVAAGERDIVAIVVVSPDHRLWPPCANCRRVIEELAPHALIVMSNRNGSVQKSQLSDTPTVPFEPDNRGKS